MRRHFFLSSISFFIPCTPSDTIELFFRSNGTAFYPLGQQRNESRHREIRHRKGTTTEQNCRKILWKMRLKRGVVLYLCRKGKTRKRNDNMHLQNGCGCIETLVEGINKNVYDSKFISFHSSSRVFASVSTCDLPARYSAHRQF